jgi:hypothetical protein
MRQAFVRDAGYGRIIRHSRNILRGYVNRL